MGFGPVALAELMAVNPAPAGAPVVNSISQNTEDTWTANCTMPSDTDVVGLVAAWIEKPDPSTNPFQGRTMSEILALEGVSRSSAGGEADLPVNIGGDLVNAEDGDVFVFAFAATDDTDDLEG